MTDTPDLPLAPRTTWRTRVDRFEALLALVVSCVIFATTLIFAVCIGLLGAIEESERGGKVYEPLLFSAAAVVVAIGEFLLLQRFRHLMCDSDQPVAVAFARDVRRRHWIVRLGIGILCLANAAALVTAAKFLSDNLRGIPGLPTQYAILLGGGALLLLLAAAYASNAFLLALAAALCVPDRVSQFLHRHRYLIDVLLTAALALVLPTWSIAEARDRRVTPDRVRPHTAPHATRTASGAAK